MNKLINKIAVEEFWNWFFVVCNDFEEDFDNIDLVNELNQWIYRLGDFSWEIGPGISEDNALIISPGGNPDLIELTKEIVAMANPCPGWEFYYAKPAKEWNLIFDFKTHDGNVIEVDANPWTYVLLGYEDGMFEIIISAPSVAILEDHDKLIVGEILLDGLLGEEKRMKYIDDIEIVLNFDDLHTGKESNIKNLAEQLT